MFNIHDLSRNACMLKGKLAHQGYDWWWHSFTAVNRLTQEEKPFFIEFFVCNPAIAEEAPTFGQHPVNPKKPSYLMVKAGCWKTPMQLHRFVPWKDITLKADAPYSIQADDCFCSDTMTYGCVSVTGQQAEDHPEWMCDAGTIEWNLTISKELAFHVGYGAGKLFRDLNAFEMYWHAEGMKSMYEGTVTLNGEVYDVIRDRSYGYADKNWGSNFTSPWIWLSSCSMTSKLTGKKLENSVFDIGGGRPKVFGVALDRKLLGAFWYEGEEYEYNFSKFWTGVKTVFDAKETEDRIVWDITQENTNSVMETHIECFKKDMLLVNYESPDGKKRHNRLWNGGNGTGTIRLYKKNDKNRTLIDEILCDHVGCEYGEYDSK